MGIEHRTRRRVGGKGNVSVPLIRAVAIDARSGFEHLDELLRFMPREKGLGLVGRIFL
jgi:hypothetical protein